jgi:hypothetical protein
VRPGGVWRTIGLPGLPGANPAHSSVGGGGGFFAKVAVTATSLVSITVQLSVPEHAPLQPENCEPVSAAYRARAIGRPRGRLCGPPHTSFVPPRARQCFFRLTFPAELDPVSGIRYKCASQNESIFKI